MLVYRIFQLLIKRISLSFIKKDKKKILLVSEFGIKGGTRTYLLQLVPFLKQHDSEIIFLNINNAVDLEMKFFLQSHDVAVKNIEFDFWCINFRDIPKNLTLIDLINYQIKELNLWITLINDTKCSTLFFSVGYPELFLYAFILPVKIIYKLHTEPLKEMDCFKKMMLKYTLSKRKQIITVSKSSQQKIWNLWCKGFQNKNIHYIYNCYVPVKIPDKTIKLLDKKIVLTIGSVEHYKNPLLFIEVAKNIINLYNDCEFWWAGDGSLFETCIELSKGYDSIKFLGNIDDVDSLYTQATIYFQPSLQESHGIATVGAMYYGLPCVVSDRGGLTESVKNNINGFVIDVNNINMFIIKIRNLLNSKNELLEMGENGKKIFKKMFIKERWILQMKRLTREYV